MLILKNGLVIVQFEVVSSKDREATIRKLSFGLIDQLTYLGIDVNEVVGFCVSVSPGFVEKVSCKWSDANLQFDVQPTELERRTIKDVYRTQSGYTPSAGSNFVLPLTPSFIERNFGRDAYQTKSGRSVVVVLPSQNLAPTIN